MFELFSVYPVFFNSMVLILGLLVGSFLNVVIHRLPIMMERSWKQEYQDYFASSVEAQEQEQEQQTNTMPGAPGSSTEQPYNLVVPRSSCPHCGHMIKSWENIPIISWLFQRGKCTACHAPISVRYPLVELLTGLLSLVVAVHFGYGPQCLAALLFVWALVALTFIDLDTMLLPDQITLPLLWLGLIVNADSLFVAPQTAIFGAAVGYLSLWSVFWVFKLLTGKEGMGFGDFKLLGAIGAWIGWAHLPIVIIVSSFVGALVGIALIAIRGKDKNIPIPFGPYLAVAGLITFLYGEWIANQYWSYILG